MQKIDENTERKPLIAQAHGSSQTGAIRIVMEMMGPTSAESSRRYLQLATDVLRMRSTGL